MCRRAGKGDMVMSLIQVGGMGWGRDATGNREEGELGCGEKSLRMQCAGGEKERG